MSVRYNQIIKEYLTIKNSIKNISNKIIDIKLDTKKELENAKCSDEQQKIYSEYKVKINRIKNNKKLKQKYNDYKKRMTQLDDEIRNDISVDKLMSEHTTLTESNIVGSNDINSIFSRYNKCDFYDKIDSHNSNNLQTININSNCMLTTSPVHIDQKKKCSKKKSNIIIDQHDKKKIIVFYNNLLILKEKLENIIVT
jgi:hypothetical protein